MKRNLWLLSVLSLALIGTSASSQTQSLNAVSESGIGVDCQSPRFESVLRKVRLLESVSYRVGWALEPGDFYKLSQECLREGTVESFKAMLKDENPIVRVMGLICLAKSVNAEEFSVIAKRLFADNAQLRYTNGCVLNQRMTVGVIAERLAEHKFFLTGAR